MKVLFTPQENAKWSTNLGRKVYNFRLVLRRQWTLDLSDELGKPLRMGFYLASGIDMLSQFRHLGFEGGLYVVYNDGTLAKEDPTPESLGVIHFLGFLPD